MLNDDTWADNLREIEKEPRIDDILDLLDCSKDPTSQAKGINLGRKKNRIDSFIRPFDGKHNENIWENCAKIISAKPDEALRPCLIQLFEWLQDMRWPGAQCIRDRLREYAKDSNI